MQRYFTVKNKQVRSFYELNSRASWNFCQSWWTGQNCSARADNLMGLSDGSWDKRTLPYFVLFWPIKHWLEIVTNEGKTQCVKHNAVMAGVAIGRVFKARTENILGRNADWRRENRLWEKNILMLAKIALNQYVDGQAGQKGIRLT